MQSNFPSLTDTHAKMYRRMGMRRLPTAQKERYTSYSDKVEMNTYWRGLADPILADEVCRVIQLLRNNNSHKLSSTPCSNHCNADSNQSYRQDDTTQVTESAPCYNPCDHVKSLTMELIQVVEVLLCHTIQEKTQSPKELIECAMEFFVNRHLKGTNGSSSRFTTDDDKSKNIFILVIGMDGAGKSSLISTLKGNHCSPCRPTLGFCPTVMSYEEKCAVNFYDIGGGDKIRGIWKNYFHDVHGVIYVFDVSCDIEKFEESIAVAKQALEHPLLRNKPLLFVCNRKSERNFRSSDFIRERVLTNMKSSSPPSILETSLHDSEDVAQIKVDSSLKWLIHSVLEDYTELSVRIAIDTEANAKLMIEDQLEKERRALKKMICRAFGVGGEEKVKTFSAKEGEEFLATELGLDFTKLPNEAAELAALVGYEKYALMIIGGLACPVSRKRKAWSWSEIKNYVLSINEEIFCGVSN